MHNLKNIIVLESKDGVSFAEINALAERVGWGSMYYSSEKIWQKTLSASSHISYVKLNTQLICFGRILEDGQMCMFYDICVHPAYQGKKIGTLLMEHLIDKIKDKHYVSIGLFVWPGNASASEFYKRFGFEIVPAMELKKYTKPV